MVSTKDQFDGFALNDVDRPDFGVLVSSFICCSFVRFLSVCIVYINNISDMRLFVLLGAAMGSRFSRTPTPRTVPSTTKLHVNEDAANDAAGVNTPEGFDRSQTEYCSGAAVAVYTDWKVDSSVSPTGAARQYAHQVYILSNIGSTQSLDEQRHAVLGHAMMHVMKDAQRYAPGALAGCRPCLVPLGAGMNYDGGVEMDTWSIGAGYVCGTRVLTLDEMARRSKLVQTAASAIPTPLKIAFAAPPA